MIYSCKFSSITHPIRLFSVDKKKPLAGQWAEERVRSTQTPYKAPLRAIIDNYSQMLSCDLLTELLTSPVLRQSQDTNIFGIVQLIRVKT